MFAIWHFVHFSVIHRHCIVFNLKQMLIISDNHLQNDIEPSLRLIQKIFGNDNHSIDRIANIS